MSAEPICTHGMPSPASCIDCMDEGIGIALRKPEKLEIEATFPAKFPGHCNGCNLPVAVGQRLARMSNGAYQHEECAR